MSTLYIDTSKPGVFSCYTSYAKDGFHTRTSPIKEFSFDHPIDDWGQDCIVQMKPPAGFRGNRPEFLSIRYTPAPELRNQRSLVPYKYIWLCTKLSKSADINATAQVHRLKARQLLTEIGQLVTVKDNKLYQRACEAMMSTKYSDNAASARAILEDILKELKNRSV